MHEHGHNYSYGNTLAALAAVVVLSGVGASIRHFKSHKEESSLERLYPAPTKDESVLESMDRDSLIEQTNEKAAGRIYADDEIDEIILNAYNVMGGADRIRDSKEKRNFLDKIGLKKVQLDDRHIISINPAEDKKSLYINLESGKFGTYLGRKSDGKANYGLAGVVPIGIVEEYITTKGSK